MTLEATSHSAKAPGEPEEMPAVRRRIGLVLSGGGYRATLFHLGVIRFLRDAKLLRDVKHICSVSGGSIMAAHLVVKWRDYKDPSDKVFQDAANELFSFIRRDVRNLVLRRYIYGFLIAWWFLTGLISFKSGMMVWLSSFVPIFRGDTWPLLLIWLMAGVGALFVLQFRKWVRVGLLQAYYDSHLCGKTKLIDLQSMDPTCPTIDLLATSLTTGGPCGFTSHRQAGFWWTEFQRDQKIQKFHPNKELPVALGVAASSAFPVVFPPVRVDRSNLHTPPGEFLSQYLTDGGVFDNLGVSRMQELDRSERVPFDYIFVSDAEGSFTPAPKRRFGWLTSRVKRTSDILMTRVSRLEYESMAGNKYVHCKLADILENDDAYSNTVGEVQADLKGIRTDLNRFNDSEIYYLVRHGYAVSRHAWGEITKEQGKPVTETELWRPLNIVPDPDALNRSNLLSVTNLFFDWRDPVTRWNAFLFVAPLLLWAVYRGSWLWGPPKPVGVEYEVHLTKSSEVTGDGAWLHPILTSLIDEGKKEKEGRSSSTGDFRIITVTTAQLGRYTRGGVTPPFRVNLSSTKIEFHAAGGYAFRVSGTGTRAVYRPLSGSTVPRRSEFSTPLEGEREHGATASGSSERPSMEFMVPESSPEDSLFAIIRVATAKDGALPDQMTAKDLKELIQLEVR
jgi:predicted acylesterase/phospholipase RssA